MLASLVLVICGLWWPTSTLYWPQKHIFDVFMIDLWRCICSYRFMALLVGKSLVPWLHGYILTFLLKQILTRRFDSTTNDQHFYFYQCCSDISDLGEKKWTSTSLQKKKLLYLCWMQKRSMASASASVCSRQ